MENSKNFQAEENGRNNLYEVSNTGDSEIFTNQPICMQDAPFHKVEDENDKKRSCRE